MRRCCKYCAALISDSKVDSKDAWPKERARTKGQIELRGEEDKDNISLPLALPHTNSD